MSQYTPRHVLVTGGAGFIGSHFVRYWLKHYPDIFIVNLDLLTYAGSRKNLANLTDPQRHLFIQGNICDQALIKKILEEYEIDTIVHFAAESHVDRSIAGPDIFIQTNLVGTFTLLEAAKIYWLQKRKWDSNSCRFHHISTDEVFGSLQRDEPRFTEEHRYQPNSPYSASKAGSDHLVHAYFHTYGLPITLTNCSNNYGPYQHPEKFIPTVINACINERAIPIYGNGSNIRDWLFVEDHCSGIDAVIRRGRLGETYNIGGNNEIANIDLAKEICGRMDVLRPLSYPHAELIQFVTDRLGHDWRYAIDATKIQQELQWWPQENIVTGLQKTVSWYHSLAQAIYEY